MRYRKLDVDGDMLFGNQQGDMLRDTPETVAQAVITRLRLWLGEWFIDQTDGTPYQQAVLGKYTSQTIEPAMRSRILDTQGVTAITAFEALFNPDSRAVTVNATISTIYGETQLVGVV